MYTNSNLRLIIVVDLVELDILCLYFWCLLRPIFVIAVAGFIQTIGQTIL